MRPTSSRPSLHALRSTPRHTQPVDSPEQGELGTGLVNAGLAAADTFAGTLSGGLSPGFINLVRLLGRLDQQLHVVAVDVGVAAVGGVVLGLTPHHDLDLPHVQGDHGAGVPGHHTEQPVQGGCPQVAHRPAVDDPGRCDDF